MTDALRRRVQDALADRYAVLEELGRGGMATVYRARDPQHDREVAVKVLRPDLAATIGGERFLREIRIAAGFAHPHILPIHDSGSSGDVLYYVMPLMTGRSLRDRLDREGQLPVPDAVRIAVAVAGALDYAHEQGVVHRDIKPENILFMGDHAVVADFGIARAVEGSGRGHGTTEGFAVGTPQYMSPEQARAGAVDGRSDIYGLGCVLYEMLTGAPPFDGATPQAVLARQSFDPPPPIRTVRPAVPPGLAALIDRALEKAPADRFARARDFATALEAVPLVSAATTPVRTTASTAQRRRRRWVLAALAVVVVATAALALGRPRAAVALDRSAYLVMPFRHRAGAAPELLRADQCEALLHDALRRWEGVTLVDPLWVSDHADRTDGGLLSLEAGLALARERGVAWLVGGEAWEAGDSVFVRAAVYDVARGGRTVHEGRIGVGRPLDKLADRFGRLAALLLTGEPAEPDTGPPTRSMPAWTAWQAGWQALERWELDSAIAAFARAADADSGYGRAQLWLATAQVWRGDALPAVAPAARRAAANGATLDPRERATAEALALMAGGQQPEACERLRTLVRADSSDFRASFLLGECLARDDVVVPDAASRTGWRFRSDHWEAWLAYRRALERYPSVHRAFRGFVGRRAWPVLAAQPYQLRFGRAALPSGDSLVFAAFPELDGSRTREVPIPRAALDTADWRPGSYEAAIDRNARELADVALGWLRTYPVSADLLEVAGEALELVGRLDLPGGQRSALGTVREARGLARDADQRVRLANAEVRVLLRLERWDEAARLADSIVRATPDPGPAVAERVASLAALLGRPDHAARLLERTAAAERFSDRGGRLVSLPPRLATTAVRLRAYVATGMRDSARVHAERARREAATLLPVRSVDTLVTAVLDLPARYSAGWGADRVRTLTARVPPLTGLARVAEMAGTDPAEAQRTLDTIAAWRTRGRGGQLTLDGVLAAAEVHLAFGDTATARELAGAAVASLPAQGSALTTYLPVAAALPRLLALSAELEADRDRAVASTRARAALRLWEGETGIEAARLQRLRAVAASRP